MGYRSTGKEEFRNALFGGNKSNYDCSLELLDQDLMCCAVPNARRVLVGVDVLARLLTGERIFLKSGLLAIYTYLGWTGPQENELFTSSMVTTLFSSDYSVCALWDLDMLGIEDPERLQTKKKGFQLDFKDLKREGIIEATETTKVKPVFDTSSRIPPNPSLNDCQEGPNFIESI
ncbi:hypothetical protein PR048_010787 [Dryococelus australis]|uniref:Uncharacterized protein n=1 Tax=Dryococelus australis TaxID=614101 RepID=A0ABQ9I3Q1_9NEOP|nr:hypothetical protein PR048_010787 [Dryococelus australis]